MKRFNWLVLSLATVLFLGGFAMAEDAKTVTGKSTCGGCSGIVDGCSLLVTETGGARWVFTGDSDSFKEAFKARGQGKTMTATLAGEPVTKKAKDGKEYKEVKVSVVKISD